MFEVNRPEDEGFLFFFLFHRLLKCLVFYLFIFKLFGLFTVSKCLWLDEFVITLSFRCLFYCHMSMKYKTLVYRKVSKNAFKSTVALKVKTQKTTLQKTH